jgi:hypothetical protein
MKRCLSNTSLAACLCAVSLAFVPVIAQSLTDKLSEEQSFYKNYGRETYSLLKIEKDVVGLYDFFGEHITDGIRVYDLTNKASIASSKSAGVKDSMLYSTVSEEQKQDFYEKFQNLVVTQDAIGGMKTSFLVGNQITTKFTPLTFNMTNFRGLRWDIWTSGVQFSALLSKSRPGALAKKDVDVLSTVTYPLDYGSSFPPTPDGVGFSGGKLDYSSRSPADDYDLLWSVHAENSIANKVDVGVTYVNHHVSDVRESEKWFDGNIARNWIPSHIHFEFYDATPEDTLDAGVFVDNVVMQVNGTEVVAKPQYQGKYMRVFVGDRDGKLLPRDLPIARPQNGRVPVIVEFKIDPEFYQGKESQKPVVDKFTDVRSVSFTYKVAGNYLVFVSTDRMIPLGIMGEQDPQTGKVVYDSITKSVGEIYERNLAISEFPPDDPGSLVYKFSTTYFGDYICRSPKLLSIGDQDLRNAFNKPVREAMYNNENEKALYKEKYNYRSYNYEYEINSSSVTYGVNFKGDLGGIKFSGEAAINRNTKMFPGSGKSKKTDTRLAATLKAERELPFKLGISGEG